MIPSKIDLNWKGPDSLTNLRRNPKTLTPGVYAIVRVVSGRASLMYIGISEGIRKRLIDHRRGGVTIKNDGPSTLIYYAPVAPFTDSWDDYWDFMEDVESMLIYTAEPKINDEKKYRFKPRRPNDNLTIVNKNCDMPGIRQTIVKKDVLKDSIEHKRERPKEREKTSLPFGL